MFTDLHIHTNFSDGKFSVSDTIDLVKENGISLFSVTDHDTVGGVESAIEYSKSQNVTCISGLELSCRNHTDINFPNDISIHILGYNIDYKNEKLLTYLTKYHARRKKILSQLIDDLNNDGFDVKYNDIFVIAGTQMRIQDIINHINSSFMSKSKKEQFINFTNCYYKQLFEIDTPLDLAIELIKEAGGIPVLAHAFCSYRDYDVINNTEQNVSALIDYLCDIGICGVEVYYPKFTLAQTEWLLSKAKQRNLIVTAGSDFHGTPTRKYMINYKNEHINQTVQILRDVNRYK